MHVYVLFIMYSTQYFFNFELYVIKLLVAIKSYIYLKYIFKIKKIKKFFRPAEDTVQPFVGLICIELGCQADDKYSCFYITQHQNIIV